MCNTSIWIPNAASIYVSKENDVGAILSLKSHPLPNIHPSLLCFRASKLFSFHLPVRLCFSLCIAVSLSIFFSHPLLSLCAYEYFINISQRKKSEGMKRAGASGGVTRKNLEGNKLQKLRIQSQPTMGVLYQKKFDG